MDMLEVQTVPDQMFESIFANTEFNQQSEIDQYELALFILRISGLQKLIEEKKIERWMGYQKHYTRKPKSPNFFRALFRSHAREACI